MVASRRGRGDASLGDPAHIGAGDAALPDFDPLARASWTRPGDAECRLDMAAPA
jgi:hypothetical protein